MIAVAWLQARRDRVSTAVWVLAVVLVGVVSASAVGQEYGGAASRAAVLRVALATPSLVALRGVPNGASLGSLTWFQIFAFLAVMVGLFNTFLATRHGRGDEERGRRELLAALPVGRLVPFGATVIVGVTANVVLGAVAALGFTLSGFPAQGAALAGATLTATGLAFLGVAMLVGELAPTSRSANGIGTAVVLACYALRGAGDALGTADLQRLTIEAAWPSWLSPIGWGEQTFAFTADRPAPLLLSIALFAAATAAAAAIRDRRDLGWSLLRERPGPAQAGRGLSGPFGLAWRLQWPSAAGWTAGAVLIGAIVGSLATAVRDLVAGDPQIRPLLAALGHGTGEIVPVFVAAVLSMVGILAAGGATQAALRLHEEEDTGRAELLLATPLARVRWLVAVVAVGWLTAALVVAGAAVSVWAGLTLVGEGDAAVRSLGQSAVELPAALIFAGLTALLVALPRIARSASWALFAAAAAVGLLGPLLDLPDVVLRASPFSDVPAVPSGDATGTVAMSAIAVALPVVAALVFRRREIRS